MVALKRRTRAANGTAKRLKLTLSLVMTSYSRLEEVNPLKSPNTEPLKMFVWGTGDMCELGLGPDASTKQVKRPRLNPYLTPEKLGCKGIVDFAAGGMHVIALDANNNLWSWGNNDHKALGREIPKNLERLVDADDNDSDDGDLNEFEATPGKVTNLPKLKLKVAQVIATDNLSAALYANGDVYAWGTFRSNDGLLGFSKDVLAQDRATKINLRNIVQLAAGKDHVLALDTKGIVYAWGYGEKYQLGRRILERHRLAGLEPASIGLYNVRYVASGDYHCFAVDHEGHVFTWGLNQFGQCAVTKNGALEDDLIVTAPTKIDFFDDKDIVQIAAGEHHTLALTAAGQVYVFGRYDMKEVGIAEDKVPELAFKDAHGRVRALPVPTPLDFGDVKIKQIGVGSHTSFAIAEDGLLYSWGFADTFAPGLGPLDEDVEVPTKIVNTATKEISFVKVDSGGQFSIGGGVEKSV